MIETLKPLFTMNVILLLLHEFFQCLPSRDRVRVVERFLSKRYNSVPTPLTGVVTVFESALTSQVLNLPRRLILDSLGCCVEHRAADSTR